MRRTSRSSKDRIRVKGLKSVKMSLMREKLTHRKFQSRKRDLLKQSSTNWFKLKCQGHQELDKKKLISFSG